MWWRRGNRAPDSNGVINSGRFAPHTTVCFGAEIKNRLDEIKINPESYPRNFGDSCRETYQKLLDATNIGDDIRFVGALEEADGVTVEGNHLVEVRRIENRVDIVRMCLSPKMLNMLRRNNLW